MMKKLLSFNLTLLLLLSTLPFQPLKCLASAPVNISFTFIVRDKDTNVVHEIKYAPKVKTITGVKWLHWDLVENYTIYEEFTDEVFYVNRSTLEFNVSDYDKFISYNSWMWFGIRNFSEISINSYMVDFVVIAEMPYLLKSHKEVNSSITYSLVENAEDFESKYLGVKLLYGVEDLSAGIDEFNLKRVGCGSLTALYPHETTTWLYYIENLLDVENRLLELTGSIKYEVEKLVIDVEITGLLEDFYYYTQNYKTIDEKFFRLSAVIPSFSIVVGTQLKYYNPIEILRSSSEVYEVKNLVITAYLFKKHSFQIVLTKDDLKPVLSSDGEFLGMPFVVMMEKSRYKENVVFRSIMFFLLVTLSLFVAIYILFLALKTRHQSRYWLVASVS